jgi:NADPH-dependent curcumin reductase CurA
MSKICRSVVLRSRPHGEPSVDNFEVVERAMPEPAEGEVLTRTLWLSIDPYMRGRMDDTESYAPSVKPGEPMTGETIGEVIVSRHPDFIPGQVVLGARGWQTHVVSPARALTLLPHDGAPWSTYLGVLGMPGATAFAGLTEVGKPEPGETVVVSAASGAVGSVVVQLAKRAGARVIGIAGGPGKCRYVRDELGADAAIDHRAVSDLGAALRDACPQGIDVYFENVGGAVQRAVFPLLNDFARMVMCGMVAEYNDVQPAPGPNLFPVVRKRLRIEGFIVLDRPQSFTDWRTFAAPLVVSGELRYREQIVEGLENAPAALLDVISGKNDAKVVVSVADPSMA